MTDLNLEDVIKKYYVILVDFKYVFEIYFILTFLIKYYKERKTEQTAPAPPAPEVIHAPFRVFQPIRVFENTSVPVYESVHAFQPYQPIHVYENGKVPISKLLN